jgi:hypothetical protein
MIRLLMFVYVALLASESRSKKPRWWKRRKKVDTFLTFAESGIYGLPRATRAGQQEPTTKQTGGMSGELEDVPTTILIRSRRPVPTTLVEKEEAAALRLQMPPIRRAGDFVHIESGVSRFDTPIGRTLTREKMLKDWTHCPRVAIAHLPVDDVTRLVAKGVLAHPHPTSPQPRGAERKKGRPTPKRSRRNHG